MIHQAWSMSTSTDVEYRVGIPLSHLPNREALSDPSTSLMNIKSSLQIVQTTTFANCNCLYDLIIAASHSIRTQQTSVQHFCNLVSVVQDLEHQISVLEFCHVSRTVVINLQDICYKVHGRKNYVPKTSWRRCRKL